MSEVIRQRRMQANYLDCGGTNKSPNFSLLGVGAKTLDESPAAQTKSRKYVCDKSATKSISGYDWTTAFEVDQIREQDAINYIINIGEKQLVGADAETDYVIVDLDQPVEGGSNKTAYHARKSVLQSRWQVLRMMTAKWAAVAISLQKEILSRVLLTQPQRHLQQKLRRYKIWLLTV